MRSSRTERPTYDIFLVLHPFRDNVAEFQILMRPLSDLGRTHLVGCDGFYSPRIDTALLVLRFPADLVDHWGEKILKLFAGRTGLPMVIPSELSAEARRRFFLEHVSGYDTYVQQYWAPDEPLPLPVRVLEHLREHVDTLPAPAQGTFFDVRASLPVHGRRRGRRFDTLGA
jgi:hypothetical protein